MKFARDYISVKKDGIHYFLDGEEVTERIYRARHPLPASDSGPCSLSAAPPNASDALAMHPKRVKEAMAEDKKRGVPVEYTRGGRPIFTSRAQQKAYLKAYNLVNHDGGYGD